MWTDDVVRASDDALAAICSEDDDWGNGRLESSMKVSEAFDIQHVDFVDEENSGHQLGNT